MSLPDRIDAWRRGTLLRKALSVLVTYLAAALAAAGVLWIAGVRLPVAAAVGAAAGAPFGYLAARRFTSDPFHWLAERDRSTAEKLRTAAEVYGESGPVVNRLKGEADDLASRIDFSSFSPPLPAKRLATLFLVIGVLAAYAAAPQDLKDDVRDNIPGGGEETPVPPGNGGGGGGGGDSGDAEDAEPGEGGGPGEEGGELEPGEPSEIDVDGEKVPVTVYPSYGSDRGTDAPESGDFVESGEYPPRSESSGSYAESLPDRHRDAIIRYFSSMVE